ncbi:hypothetical protein [Photobacterium damselae]|uniref:hypothetical protein n=1 Tax=Photobacterium damselae TaxID=38293 RepID=UPI001485A9A1|nr:hypothetical protein [Photobacterium damselae]
MDDTATHLDFTRQAMIQWRTLQSEGAVLIKNNPASKRFRLRGRIGQIDRFGKVIWL